MAVTPIDTAGATPPSAEAKFQAALDKSQDELSDEDLTTALANNAVTVGGQFIIMPKVQEILNEAMSSEDDEE
ncbi:hypothetical protein P0Y43_20440 [Pseudomonas entomophila]|uniref:hypothetical protein n=1 Tax=Pseudomonas entomophila TaxID=312306 RepID=UPI0023D83026|nr:hypothetical protein [Pseudomonas entomophila]MDF0733065.1 hypothetical protein [Pseudomonas entomophila]